MRITRYSQVCVIALMGIILLLDRPFDANAVPPEPPIAALKEAWWSQHLTDLQPPLVLTNEVLMPAPSAAETPSSYTGWTRLAFVSYRNANWEVYTARGDGSQATRVTNHTATELEPRLNRGGTRIAFASNRTGAYEIYVANADGSDVRQLTSGSGHKRQPDWSPDGRRLVFAQEHGDNWDIRIINADGTGAQWVASHPDDDLYPSWSRSGELVWVRYLGFDGTLWAANSDGSQAHAISSPFRFLQNPVWSPNHNYIGFDFDADGDYWSEIGVYDVQHYHLAYVKDTGLSFVDLWMGDWAPDGLTLLASKIEYVVEGNQLLIQRASVMHMRSDGSAPLLPMISGGIDMEGDWTTTDTMAPVTQVNPLPRFVRNEVIVTWSGADVGGAGISSYDIDFRNKATGPWNLWLTTPETSATLWREPGATVALRSRARDRAYNEEAWPTNPDGDALTTFYRWSVQGHVRDNRNVVVPHASVTAPTALNSAQSDAMGLYAMYVAAGGDYTMTASHAGYAPIVPTSIALRADRGFDAYVGPPTNLLRNGDFELGGPAPANWLVEGNIPPTVRADAAATGRWGALVGQQWSTQPFTQMTSPPGYNYAPTLSADTGGTLHLAWQQRLSQNQFDNWIVYVTCRMEQPCSIEERLFPGSMPQMAIGSDNRMHLAWAVPEPEPTSYTLMYANRPLTGTWSTPQTIGALGGSYDPSLALVLDSLNRPHVLWADVSGVYYRKRLPSGEWDFPELVTSSRRPSSLAITPNREVHVLSSGQEELSYFRRQTNGAWQQEAVPGSSSGMQLATLADPAGRLHVLSNSPSTDGVHYRTREPGGTWTTPVRISSTHGYQMSLAQRANGDLVAFWYSGEGLWIAYRANGLWSVPHPLPGYNWEPNQLSLWAHPTNDWIALAVPAMREDNYPYWYHLHLNRFLLQPEQAGVSRLSQSFTIPVSQNAPTLSFRYRYQPEGSATLDPATLHISTAGQTHLLQTFVPVTTTQQAWFDMSRWAGQTVTVTFNVSATADARYGGLLLDDVAVGPWLTPQVLSVEPATVPPRVSMDITVHGDNFVLVPTVRVGNVTLTNVRRSGRQVLLASLPDTLSPGVYDVQVIHPGGQEAVLQAGLTVGGRIFLPAVMAN
ncbi:carboxypeptidase regulatory-like domain-containing protein [Candidatus Amarolinea dominans]|uniref:carboxypeptidase regulatory-like domain-containing protein n=1 Tax=Candidatus Amarolinea dominans TaxID=3140696 RepID=UPI001D8BCC36|nr:PD40 domain-containing protein [Anaerolineae bacterium]